MTERLKQIWGGFEEKTTRNLTGRGIDAIPVPSRADWRAEPAPLPDGVPDPAAAAFAALKLRLAAQERKAGKSRRGSAPADAPDFAMAGEAEAARDLVKGLQATGARLERPLYFYEDALSSADRKKLSRAGTKRRRKFLGLF